MRFILLFLLLTTTVQAASPEFICSMRFGPSFYRELKELPLKDKAKHCALSCYLTIKCSAVETFHVGVIKEIIDLFGDGNAETSDIRANLDGITLADSGRALSKSECLKECKLIHQR